MVPVMTHAATFPPLRPLLNFAIDRATAASLADQVTAGLQGAILSGSFAPGARLPGVRALAQELGVSHVVASQAVRRLADEGLLVARRRTGIHVAATPRKVWRGHVLWLTSTIQSYYFAARQEALLARLGSADLRVTTLCLDSSASGSLAPVLAALDTLSIAAVVSGFALPGLASECARRAIPLVSNESAWQALTAGCVTTPGEPALQALAAHCRALGITRPALLAPIASEALQVEAIFAAHGLALATVPTPPVGWLGDGPLEQMESVGYAATQAMLAAPQRPELLYVADDYAARGALLALAEAGVRLPQDLQFVAAVNRCHRPSFQRDFTRIERDPAAIGTRLAEVLLQVLAQPASPPLVVTLPARFVAGTTTHAI